MKELTPGRSNPYTFGRDPEGAGHLRVLVADNDEAELQLTIRQLGEAWPFARDLVAEGATDGVQVVEKIRHHAYAFVVLDWNVPHPAGTDVLLAIRAAGRRVPVVVVSAEGREAIASDLESLGAAFVNKRELHPTRFCNAMAAAILWTQRAFGLVRADPIRARKSAILPAHAVEDRFVMRSSPLPVRPTAHAGLREPQISVQETPRGDRTLIARTVKVVRKQLSVAAKRPPCPALGGTAPPARPW